MKRRKTALFRAGLDTLYYTRAHKALQPFTAGRGVIFTLHQVRPEPPEPFAPNRILSVTPEFLDSVILRIRAAGLDIVDLDEAVTRLRAETAGRRFACITLDDGYLDNLEYACPVLERHQAPATIYVTTCMPDGTALLWWFALEKAVADCESLHLPEPLAAKLGQSTLACASIEEKYAAYEAVYWPLRALGEEERRAAAAAITERAGFALNEVANGLSMSWDQIAMLAGGSLVTIGAHSVSHPALADLSASAAEYEIAESRKRIAEMTGYQARHFAYPFGDAGSCGPREFASVARLGFDTGVTTRPGMLFPDHLEHLTALPRVSLNGDYQSLHYLELFLSGVPFALFNRFRKVAA